MVLIEGLRGGKSRVTVESRSLYTRSRACIRMRFMIFTGMKNRGAYQDASRLSFYCKVPL